MHTLIHTTKNNSDVTFDGELIVESTSRIDLTEYDERTFVLKVFALSGGGFAVLIELKSSNFNIKDVVEVEKVDTADDVELVLAAFEPMEFVKMPRTRAITRHVETRRRLRHQLDKAYYNSLAPVVKAVRDYNQSHPGCEYLAREASVPIMNRIWKFLGRASLGRLAN